MIFPTINHCPSTLAEGNNTYSRAALKRLFNGKKVSHLFASAAPFSDESTTEHFEQNRKQLSISGVQEKFSLLLDKNKLRLIDSGEQGEYILKPIPSAGQHPEQMPANEHLTMQIARQVFGIETAENGLLFFTDGTPAYLTKRFDLHPQGGKWAQEDFASIAGLTPQTHGDNYKYQGSYLDVFQLLKQYVPAYKIEAPKLLQLIVFNYLFSNGDAHFKNFSLIETSFGDFKLSPAYDLINSRIHINDSDFALEQGLLPPKDAQGKIREQFLTLGKMAELSNQQTEKILLNLCSHKSQVLDLIGRSFLADQFKRNYEQAYLTRLKKLTKP